MTSRGNSKGVSKKEEQNPEYKEALAFIVRSAVDVSSKQVESWDRCYDKWMSLDPSKNTKQASYKQSNRIPKRETMEVPARKYSGTDETHGEANDITVVASCPPSHPKLVECKDWKAAGNTRGQDPFDLEDGDHASKGAPVVPVFVAAIIAHKKWTNWALPAQVLGIGLNARWWPSARIGNKHWRQTRGMGVTGAVPLGRQRRLKVARTSFSSPSLGVVGYSSLPVAGARGDTFVYRNGGVRLDSTFAIVGQPRAM
ncbi:hypothetical protein ACN28S_28425 [Cystobacter fuscus]